MTETIAREKAMTTLAEYGLTLCESWSGYAEVMHAYHAPQLAYWLAWEEYLERIDTVQRTKPCNEIPVRLAAMQPVSWEWEQTPARDRLNEAHASLNEASDRWNEAHASNLWNEARDLWNEASDRLKEARDRWLTDDAASIRRIHDEHCIGCTWDWERREMTFEVTQ